VGWRQFSKIGIKHPVNIIIKENFTELKIIFENIPKMSNQRIKIYQKLSEHSQKALSTHTYGKLK
jgi:hypothetical protein